MAHGSSALAPLEVSVTPIMKALLERLLIFSGTLPGVCGPSEVCEGLPTSQNTDFL